VRRALLLLACGSLAACGDAQDIFFVRQGDADLPVWLQGQRDADTYLFVVHGLGASGKVYDWMPAFDALERRYGVVYWDQRSAGISQGNAAGDVTVEQLVDDLGAVLTAVRDRYHPRRLVMLGHSLGGGESQAFLRDPAHQQGIAGYVDVCGGRSLPESYRVVAARLKAEGQRLAADTTLSQAERDQWTQMVAFYDAHPEFPRDGPDRATHAKYVTDVLALLGFDLTKSTDEMYGSLASHGVSDTFFGGFDVFAYGQNTAAFMERFDTSTMDLTPADVSTISVPALVLAGRFDFSVPVEVPQETFDAISPNSTLSRFVVLENASHWAMWDDPDGFSTAVTDFVDALP